MPTTNQLIQLGRRLRDGVTPEDAEAFDAYRASFESSLTEVEVRCRQRIPGIVSAAARLKTLESTVAKLRRQQIRLPRIQDIAGLRLIVRTEVVQDETLRSLEANDIA